MSKTTTDTNTEDTSTQETPEKSLVSTDEALTKSASASTASEAGTKEGAETPAKEPQKAAAPEKYELKLPEDSLLDAAHLEKVSSYAKKNGLSNDDAQAILERDSENLALFQAGQQTKVQQINQTWLKELSADPEIGGEHLEESGRLAYRALAKYWGDEFVEVITKANMNHHPTFFKGLVALGKDLADDSIETGTTSGKKGKSTAEMFYGSNS